MGIIYLKSGILKLYIIFVSQVHKEGFLWRKFTVTDSSKVNFTNVRKVYAMDIKFNGGWAGELNEFLNSLLLSIIFLIICS